MPADARLLLRAAVASSSTSSENGIKDRFASYQPKTKALRCTACDYLIIKHESLWASHAASKSHRNNVATIRREEEEKERVRELQREEEEAAMQEKEEQTATGSKRKERGPDEETTKKAKTIEVNGQSTTADAEWERFQREVLNAATTADQPSSSNYANATIEVRPALNSSYGDNDIDEESDEEENGPLQKVAETEAERRVRLDREDREEILARLEEEQRVQDEADERVSALKSRFEKLKQARAAKKR
jgi:zinc finger protein 830